MNEKIQGILDRMGDVTLKDFVQHLTKDDLEAKFVDLLTKDLVPNNWMLSETDNSSLMSTWKFESLEGLCDRLRTLSQEEALEKSVHGVDVSRAEKDWSLCLRLYNSDSVASIAKKINSVVEKPEQDVKKLSEAVEGKPKQDVKKLSENDQICEPYRFVGNKSTVKLMGDGENKTLLIPVCTMGEWTHPKYDKLKFTQEDIDKIVSNFNSGALGFESPLYLGHAESQGAPSPGWLKKLVQHDNTLFGLYNVTDEIYRAVENKEYRYSSAEFANIKSKKTGEELGIALYGMALVNRPFIPWLPRVKALSEDTKKIALAYEIEEETMSLNTETAVSAVSPSESTTPSSSEITSTSTSETIQGPSIVSESPTASASASPSVGSDFDLEALVKKVASLEELLNDTKSHLNKSVEEKKALQDTVNVLEKERQDSKVAEKLNWLGSLTIPQEQREKYEEHIKKGTFGDSEAVVLESLEAMASVYKDTVVRQYGSNTSTMNLNDESYPQPYADVIKETLEQVQKLKG